MTNRCLFTFTVAALLCSASFAQTIQYREYLGDPTKPFDARFIGKQINDKRMIAKFDAARGQAQPEEATTQTQSEGVDVIHHKNGPKHSASLSSQTLDMSLRTGNTTETSNQTTVTQPGQANANFVLQNVSGCTATASTFGNTIFISGGTTNCAIDLAVNNGTQLKTLSIVHVGQMQLARKAYT
jgi:hypothetical protein